jgi:hypothetical protein
MRVLKLVAAIGIGFSTFAVCSGSAVAATHNHCQDTGHGYICTAGNSQTNYSYGANPNGYFEQGGSAGGPGYGGCGYHFNPQRNTWEGSCE